MKKTIIEKNSCDLDRLIEEVYGQEINIAYSIMMDQRKITAFVYPLDPSQKPLIEAFVNGAAQVDEEMFEALLCGLCSKCRLKQGEYLICFDD